MHRTLVIAKDDQIEVNQFCNNIGAEGETFVVPLYTDLEHTHYWAGWNITQEQSELINANSKINVFESAEEGLEKLNLKRGEQGEV